MVLVIALGAAALGAEARHGVQPRTAASSKAKPAAPTLSVAKKGSYVYWFTFTDADGAARTSLPVRFKGTSTELDLGTLSTNYSGAKLYVMDKKTGNLAIAQYPPSAGTGNVKLSADDFDRVRNVRLRIVAEDGKPIESAIVNITDGRNNEHSAVVTPADAGVATFHDVASGEVSVSVEADKLRKTIDSDIEIPTKRAVPDYEREIKVAGDVHTLPVAPTPKAEPKPASKAGATLSMLLQSLAGLIILALIVAIVVIVLKARGVTAKSALQGLGVELPTDASGHPVPGAPASPATDSNVCQFCGQTKDANGRCACTITPGMVPGATPASSISSGPRLVGSQGVYAGHIFEITLPSVVIGREADNPIALPNDATVSRRHATISQVSGGYSIRDEGSSNGTFVNGARITEQKLSPGDEVQIGGTKFRFEF